jgi:hypothetical protein
MHCLYWSWLKCKSGLHPELDRSYWQVSRYLFWYSLMTPWFQVRSRSPLISLTPFLFRMIEHSQKLSSSEEIIMPHYKMPATRRTKVWGLSLKFEDKASDLQSTILSLETSSTKLTPISLTNNTCEIVEQTSKILSSSEISMSRWDRSGELCWKSGIVLSQWKLSFTYVTFTLWSHTSPHQMLTSNSYLIQS